MAFHAAVAKRIGGKCCHLALDADLGSLYLGSTAPDIHILMRWERERTHFFDLEKYDEQSAVATMFEAHPELARPAELRPPTVAFVCGYISHLVIDEIWINDIYRPFFGRSSPLAGDARADIMDRAVQYELDRQARADREAMAHIVREIAQPAPDMDVGFIQGGALSLWQGLMVETLNHPPDWERFRFFGGRALRAAGIETPEAFAQFVKTLPGLVTEAADYLSRERLDAFVEKSLTAGRGAIEEYLG
ncbi:MAG: zinc dependent phospholipase C family protein [Dehalococcoidia bacterium]